MKSAWAVRIGPEHPFDAWDEARYDYIWRIANYNHGGLSALEGVVPFPDRFLEAVTDPTFVRIHQTQRHLLAGVDLASDIDNSLGEAPAIPRVSQIGALAAIAERTVDVDDEVSRIHPMRQTLLQKLGGTRPISQSPGFPAELTLPIDGGQVPARLLSIQNAAHEIAALLPEHLRPWARCAWLVLENPTLPNWPTPVAMAEAGSSDFVLSAAKIFPRLSRISNPIRHVGDSVH